MKTAERYVKSYTAKSVSAFDMEKSNKIRHPEIDILRGIALLMMLVLHVIWCMDYLDFNVNMNIYFIQPVVPALFLMLAGISLHLSYCRNENYKNWLKYMNNIDYFVVLLSQHEPQLKPEFMLPHVEL